MKARKVLSTLLNDPNLLELVVVAIPLVSAAALLISSISR